MKKFIFNQIKKKIPKISETEMIALRSGSVSIDKDILSGKINFPKRFQYETKCDSVDSLLKEFDHRKIFPNDNQNLWIKKVAKEKYFSFLIDKQYGGIKLSTNELSNVLTKISSVDPALGVVVMVPNSLGPGELLTKYGTMYQKNNYLPKLANGTYIPCFGLTGQIDEGIVTLSEKTGKIEIEITLNKRYITLAPVANLLGIAFSLKDPNQLLGKEGISLALVEKGHPGLEQNTFHNPLDVGFPNGTVKGTIQITTDQIIGGENEIGNGWKMLMECLSAGRGVSLPATAQASSKVAAYGMWHYVQIRTQFGMTLSQMEAIQEKMNTIIYNTWLIQSSVKMTNDVLDSGEMPSVISAIMKQQTTERARIVLNEAMDIHGGAAICMGYSNFLEKFYKSIPIGITVEGSNTLTRSLIIFSQGLNKSHPYIFSIVEDILNNDVDKFWIDFCTMVKQVLKLYAMSFSRERTLEQQIVQFATLTNFIALKGGKIKREQMLSGEMADIFGNLYFGISLLYEKSDSQILNDYCMKRILSENQVKINKIIDNLELELRMFLFHLKRKPKFVSFNEESKFWKEIVQNEKIIEKIKEHIYTNKSVLHDMESLLRMDPTDKRYEELRKTIINVGEYPIHEKKE